MAFNQFPIKSGIPSGTTAARPANPVIGDTYYDGTLGFLFIFDGTNFIPCSAPAAQPSIAVTDVGTNVAYGTVQGSVAFTEGTSGGKAAGFTAIQGSTTQTSTSNLVVITVTGTPGSYAFTGTAYNGFGTSPVSPSVSQTLTSLPQAPTIGTASTSGVTSDVTVTWTLGATGGKVLSAITITPYLNGTTAQTAATAATTSSTSHTFTGLTAGSSYTFKVKTTNANGVSLESSATNSVTVPIFVTTDALIVAGGGGGGGGGGHGAGGGAGGFRTNTPSLIKNTNYTVTVGGAGGGGTPSTLGGAGGNSVFSTITSAGGGVGGQESGTLYPTSGGSGGGAFYGANTPGSGNTPSTSPSQGNSGGTGSGSSPNYGSGGGGGAGASGGNGTSTTGGNGGNGTSSSITGTSVTYAGGGGGSTYDTGGTPGTGGTGGGAAGVSGGGTPNDGTVNTGGGGGGNERNGGAQRGGNGGSGVVILRWLTADASITVGAGLTADSTGTDGSYSYKRFTAGSGNVSFA